MRKTAAILVLGMTIFIPGCKLGTGSGNNYLNFEVIDTQNSSSAISEIYIVALSSGSSGAYNVYNPITKTSATPGDAITLGGSDSVNVSVNNAAANNLVSSSFLPNGFYTYSNSNSIAWPDSGNYQNKNSYKVSLNYLDNSYSAIMNNIPPVYTISSANCEQRSGNPISCTVTKTGGTLADAVVVYTLNAGNTNQCTAKVTTSLPTIDYVSFNSSCNLGSSSTLTLQIAYNVPLTNVTQSSNASFNMRGQYYFVSKSVTVTITQ